MAEYYEARVLFDYGPVTSDELCLRVGETVEVRVGGGEEEEEGWLYGSDLEGRHGTFPANYVADLRPSVNCSAGDDYAGGSVSSSVPPFHGRAEHVGCVEVSATTPMHGVVAEQNDRDVVSTTSGYSKDDSYGAPYNPEQDTPASPGEHGRAFNDVATATPTTGGNMSGSVPTVTTSQDQAIARYAAATGAEIEGAASSQLPEGWLCAMDDNSEAMYYYTADGKSSSWTRPTAATTAAIVPVDGSGDRKKPGGFPSAGPSPNSVSVLLKRCHSLPLLELWEGRRRLVSTYCSTSRRCAPRGTHAYEQRRVWVDFGM